MGPRRTTRVAGRFRSRGSVPVTTDADAGNKGRARRRPHTVTVCGLCASVTDQSVSGVVYSCSKRRLKRSSMRSENFRLAPPAFGCLAADPPAD